MSSFTIWKHDTEAMCVFEGKGERRFPVAGDGKGRGRGGGGAHPHNVTILQHRMQRELHSNAAATDQHDAQSLCSIVLEQCGEIHNRIVVSDCYNVGVGRHGQMPRHCTACQQQPAIANLIAVR